MGGRPTGRSAAAGVVDGHDAPPGTPRLSGANATTVAGCADNASKTGDGAPVGEQLPARGVVRADIRCSATRPIRGRAVKLMLDSDA